MATTTATEFGAWLKETRTARGLSVNGLAEKAGVSNASISKFEAGKLNPRKRTAVQIAEALIPVGVSLPSREAVLRAALTSAGYAAAPAQSDSLQRSQLSPETSAGELVRDPIFDDGFEAGYDSDDGLNEEDRENLRQEARDYYRFKAEQLRRQRSQS